MDPILGSILYFAGNFAPRGWMTCEGQLLPIAQYAALFSILGTTYGGDGMTNFALPKISPKADNEIPVLALIAVEGIFPSRQ